MLDMFAIGFSGIFNPYCLGLIFAGVLVGVIFGCIPGLNNGMATILLLPLTYGMTSIQALALIMGLFVGGCSGGLISAILLKIPGQMGNLATTFDGSPMARNGQAGKALGAGIFFSFLGGTFGYVVLFAIAAPIARIAIRFSPVEYFSIAVFSLTMIAGLSGESLLKGLAVGLMGMAFSFIGMSEIDGLPRLTMGFVQLNAGLDLLPALIGLYAITELLKASRTKKAGDLVQDYKIKGFGFTWTEFKQQLGNFFRSALIGTGIGILPGIGGITSSLLAYTAAKSTSKHPEKFGTGVLDGVVAPETANNASIGGSMVPLLTLGIPGDGYTVIVLGALIIKGLNPGPMLMVTNARLVYAIYAALILANFFAVAIEYFGIRGLVKMLKVPSHILMPIIIVFAIVGAIGVNNRVFDAWTVVIFGLFGYLMEKLNFSLTPIILGFVLGPIAEINLRRGLMLSQGSLLPFIIRPISCAFLILTVISIILTPRLAKKGQSGKQSAA